MRAALRIPQAEIPERVKRGGRAHCVQVVQNAGGFGFVPGEDKPRLLHCAKQRVDDARLVDGGNAGYGGGGPAAPHRVFEGAVFRDAAQRVCEKMHTHGNPFRFVRN